MPTPAPTEKRPMIKLASEWIGKAVVCLVKSSVASWFLLLVSVFTLAYTIYSENRQRTRLMADEIRADLVRFASDSELLIDRVYTKGKRIENSSRIHLVYTSTLREIESVSIRPKTYRDLFKFIQAGIYRSDWYRRQQFIGDSIRSVSARFYGRLRILKHLASLQIRIIEYPTSTEAIWELIEEPGLDVELLEECANDELEIANDMVKCIDSIVWPLIQGTEVVRTKSFTESGGFLASFGPLNGLGESLQKISFKLNCFIQELTMCLIKIVR